MNFHPDFDTGITCCFATRDEGFSNLFQSFRDGDFFREAIGPDFYPFAPDVANQIDESFAGFDIFINCFFAG